MNARQKAKYYKKRCEMLEKLTLCDNRILYNGHSWNYCPNCGAKMDGGDD